MNKFNKNSKLTVRMISREMIFENFVMDVRRAITKPRILKVLFDWSVIISICKYEDTQIHLIFYTYWKDFKVYINIH